MSPLQRPIFLLSLPRSGSTFIQRVLASHEQIATASEPWLLLPYLYTLRQEGAVAEYGYRIMVKAIEDFCLELPKGRDDYLEEIRDLALRLYSKASHADATYFLDKTPRYHLIVEDLFRLFPEGKFVFLWRNPLAVVASIIETWGRGRWSVYRFRLDLFRGLGNLVSAYQAHSDRVVAARYEDLLEDPDPEYRRMLAYLDLEPDPGWVSRIPHIELRGRMGDAVTDSGETVSRDPLGKWRSTLASPLRKAWCRRYLAWIGQERLSVMGYDLTGLLEELDGIPSKPYRVGSDAVRLTYGRLTSVHRVKRLFQAERRARSARDEQGSDQALS